MSQIVPKLNLNKTPNLVQNNSLIFAKNIRLDVDSTIHRDYGIFPLSIHKGHNTSELVNYDNILNRIISDLNNKIVNDSSIDSYYNIIKTNLECISLNIKNISDEKYTKNGSFKIVGHIANSNEFYLFIYGTYVLCNIGSDNTITEENKTVSHIIRYDEKDEIFYPCNCNWSYSGGTITGCVINNLLGEKILNIGEYGLDKLVPIKCINLNKSSIKDDENIYTQTPNIPIVNLNYVKPFSFTIPNGTYQFFIRYKIREDFYTNWFPVSKELFTGNSNTKITSFGTVKYVNTHRSSDESFTFSVDYLFGEDFKSNYKSFQLGFICATDDAIVGRAWKHFSFDTKTINFDYDSKDAREIEVIDLISHTYQLYNVGNIANFKNKLYISNYTETNFNENLSNLANDVIINIGKYKAVSGFEGYDVIENSINGKYAISGIKVDDVDKYFSGENGIIKELMSIYNNGKNISTENILKDCIYPNNNVFTTGGSKKYAITNNTNVQTLDSAKDLFKKKYNSNSYSDFVFNDNNIDWIEVNDKLCVGSTAIPSTNNETVVNNIVSTLLSEIYNQDRYLDMYGNFIDGTGVINGHISIKIYRTCTFKERYLSSKSNNSKNSKINSLDQTITRPGNNDFIYEEKQETIERTDNYCQSIDVYFNTTSYVLKEGTSDTLLNNTTLIPYQKYKFYIHYVKQNGETTNGYYCGGNNAGIIEIPYEAKSNTIIYPIFKNIKLPENYVSCFFSILHVGNKVATVFDSTETGEIIESCCLDINIGLLPMTENITIKQETDNGSEIITHKGKYYFSSDSSDPNYFGAYGVLTHPKETGFNCTNNSYIINDYSLSESEDVQLIKCTQYINPLSLETESENGNLYNVYKDFNNMNLLGYLCKVYALDKDRTKSYYTDGSSLYRKRITDKGSTSDKKYDWNLIELKNHLDINNEGNENVQWIDTIMALELKETNPSYIYSNYNLNHIILSEDPVEKYTSYYNTSYENTTEKTQTSGSIVLRLFKSLTMSMIYEFSSMYKEYTRKTYSVYKENEITRFDNTIRSSELEGDETSINIFKFNSIDYYNVPTNRGIIVNLLSIGDSILVHTQDSMFKFTGSNTLSSSNGEIQQNESEPFNTGVSEIFGSDFGFAGLQNKTDHIVTENGYIFFDRDSRIIYIYSGQGQIVKLSDSIEKLFRHRDIKNIYFANDYYNNRFFMSIIFYDNYIEIENEKEIIKQKLIPVTLSFSTLQDVKSFVSLHDFYYFRAFNTKTKCYFITDDNKDVCSINKNYKGCYTKLELTSDIIYPAIKETKKITAKAIDDNNSDIKEYDINAYDSIIDVIDNNDFERVKSLNAVNWCSNIIDKEFKDISDSDFTTLKVAEDINNKIPCKYMRIYTDTCITPLNDFRDVANNSSINSSNSYKYPRYNQGFWTFNYFRNIQNSKGHISKYDSDNNSLIEGKYFVIRFVFDNEFKLETLSLNYNDKI